MASSPRLPWPAYPLSVHLADVGETFCKGVGRHLVAVLVAEFGRLGLRSLCKRAGVCDRTGDDTADGWRDLEDVGDGRRVDEFILAQQSAWEKLQELSGSSILGSSDVRGLFFGTGQRRSPCPGCLST